jgi:hypothetical protein
MLHFLIPACTIASRKTLHDEELLSDCLNAFFVGFGGGHKFQLVHHGLNCSAQNRNIIDRMIGVRFNMMAVGLIHRFGCHFKLKILNIRATRFMDNPAAK